MTNCLRAATFAAALVVTSGAMSTLACSGSTSSQAGVESASGVVGPQGGSVTTPSGTGVTVPAGALSTSVTVTVNATPSAPAPSQGPEVSTPYTFGPEGEQFSVPVTVTIAFDPSSLPPGKTASDVVILTAPAGTTNYAPLGTSIVDSTHASATTSHFSTFVCVVPTAPFAVDAGADATLGSPDGSIDSGAASTDGAPGPTPDGSDASSASTTVDNSSPGSCASPTIPIAFTPMYSAFIPGSSTQAFQVPAIMTDGHAASWSSSDPTAVQLVPDSTTGGILITVQGTGGANGVVTIFAAEASGCGASTLTITANTESDWTIGNARYNDGVALLSGDGGSPVAQDGGGGTACTSCHGPTAPSGPFVDVTRTPEQTGGFSDQDLVGIVVQGTVPDGGYFDPSVLVPSCTDAGVVLGPGLPACASQAYAEWHSFHQWTDITAAEQPGIVCYLRSLQPASETGSSNFGGASP